MHITIIGLGGVGHHIATALYHQNHNLHLIDPDEYEPRNSTRQPLALLYKGHKVEAHKSMFDEFTLRKIHGPKITTSTEWVTKDTSLALTDLVIAAVDNNKARNACRELAMAMDTPLVIAANESIDSEANLLLPHWQNTKLDPWVEYPALWDEEVKTVVRCTDDAHIEEEPQTPMANWMAATGALFIISALVKNHLEVGPFDPCRTITTANRWTVKRPADILPEHELPTKN